MIPVNFENPRITINVLDKKKIVRVIPCQMITECCRPVRATFVFKGKGQEIVLFHHRVSF